MPHTETNILLSFLLLLIIAGFTAYYANLKGRNPLIWFLIGILLGIFAPLILLFFPAVKKPEDDGLPTMTLSPPDPSLQQLSETLPLPTDSPHPEEENKLWYYLDQEHQPMGPVSIIALRELWNRGLLELNHYVWTNGMEQWQKVESLPALKDLLNKS